MSINLPNILITSSFLEKYSSENKEIYKKSTLEKPNLFSNSYIVKNILFQLPINDILNFECMDKNNKKITQETWKQLRQIDFPSFNWQVFQNIDSKDKWNYLLSKTLLDYFTMIFKQFNSGDHSQYNISDQKAIDIKNKLMVFKNFLINIYHLKK